MFNNYNKCTEMCLSVSSPRNNTLSKTYSLTSLCQPSSYTVLISQHDQVSPEAGSLDLLVQHPQINPQLLTYNAQHEMFYKGARHKMFIFSLFFSESQESPVSQAQWAARFTGSAGNLPSVMFCQVVQLCYPRWLFKSIS